MRNTGAVALTDAGGVVRASTEFAIDLYRALARNADNLAFSPLNVFASLAMDQPPAVRVEINGWVADHTSNMIRELLAPETTGRTTQRWNFPTWATSWRWS